MSRSPIALRSRLRWLGSALAAALLLAPRIATAQGGINLSWGDCGAWGLAQRNFACNTNAGQNPMIASVITPQPMPRLNGMSGVIVLQTNQPTLSPWWDFTGCRASPPALSMQLSFPTSGNCIDPWGGAASGSVSYQFQFGVPNGARILASCSISPPVSSDGVSEYYMFGITFDDSKTVGTGSCSGCTDGACIVLNGIRVTAAGGDPSYTVTPPLIRSFIAWQPPHFSFDCPLGVTPTRNETWGSVKALYR